MKMIGIDEYQKSNARFNTTITLAFQFFPLRIAKIIHGHTPALKLYKRKEEFYVLRRRPIKNGN